MKTQIFKLLIIALCITSLTGCNDELNKLPLDQISSEDFWNTTSDLDLYINQFYGEFDGYSSDRLDLIYSRDLQSDDLVYSQANDRLRGSRVVPPTGGWDYTRIRKINYFFENYKKCQDPFDEYKPAVGAAHFLRAWFFFNLVKEYGDVPFFTKVLQTDSEELYMSRTPRNQVVDSIIVDLDRAIEYMPSGKQMGGTKFCKEIALLVKSRVCLYEGTWEKYHANDDFKVANPNPDIYLNLAVDAADALIKSGQFSIYNKGAKSEWNYFFFADVDYSGNPEILLWKKYDVELGLGHTRQYQIGRGKGGGVGLTKSLIESYLCTDGKPISLSSLYKGDEDLATLAKNRDPRLRQTISTPGFPIEVNGSDTTRFVRPAVDQSAHTACPTGYQVDKGLNFDPIHHISLDTKADGFTGWIFFRYAEALLNYAEAKAELGTITQADIDKTIKLLRDRVGMPNLVMANIQNDPNWLFPELSPIINEIRRERRIEMVLESLRWDDIARWAAADKLIIGKRPLGGKFNNVDYSDLSATDYQLTDGYFDPLKLQLPDGYGFRKDRDYLSPIATQELTLNPNLEQNPGWEK